MVFAVRRVAAALGSGARSSRNALLLALTVAAVVPSGAHALGVPALVKDINTHDDVGSQPSELASVNGTLFEGTDNHAYCESVTIVMR